MSQDLLNRLVKQAVVLHKAKRYDEAELIYNRVLNRDPFNQDLQFLLGDLYLRKEFNALGINLLANLLRANPGNAAAWCNMGIGFRKEGDKAQAMECWTKALAVGGESPEVCNNIATIYSDSAEPTEALKWLARTLAMDPENVEANWQKALALLSMAEWQEGWKHYEFRQKLESWDSRPSVEAPIWDGKQVDHLYIHGEQGVGDEVMFASAIPLAAHLARRVTLEVNAKVVGIAKQTWPHFRVVKEATPGDYDAKVPIGSLIGMFGMNPKPYLEPHPEKVAMYRRALEELGAGPYVAVTWVGGTKMTRVEDRSMGIETLNPILREFTCVSAQYAGNNPIVEEQRKASFLPMVNVESTGEDLHDQAALFKAVDAVVTVQQTAVHVAGSVGAQTWALIGEKPHWRYGISGDRLPFYSSVRLLRKSDDWGGLVQTAVEGLRAHFGSVQGTKQAAA